MKRTEHISRGDRPGVGTRRRRRAPAALLCVLFVLVLTRASSFAAIVQQTQTWTDEGTAGWSHKSDETTVSNGDGYLNIAFKVQSVPYAVSDTAFAGLDQELVVTNLAMRFLAEDMRPSAVRLYLHSRESGNLWYLSIPVRPKGEWATYSVPIDFEAGWRFGPHSKIEEFERDRRSFDWVGVYVRRHGSVVAQDYRIDDFVIQGMALEEYEEQAANPDKDGDEIPDEWEAEHGLDGRNDQDAAEDRDGDGMSNYAEYRAGTSPNDPDSSLKLDIVRLEDIADDLEELPGQGTVLAWESVTGRVYSVWRQTDLMADFLPIAENLDATPPVNVYEDLTTTDDGPYFYLIRVDALQ